MEHFFNLPVEYQGEQLNFSARLVTFAYSFKFYIMVNHTELTFEKDDEGQYRMLGGDSASAVDPELVQAIVCSLVKLQE